MASDSVPLLKMNGAGNKILVVDQRAARLRLNGRKAAELGEHEALHFDQLMAIEPAIDGRSDAYVRIFNIDGSEAEACGNGTRCVADLMMTSSGVDRLVLETSPGLLTASRREDGLITVDMGKPKFDWEEIPLAEEFRDTRAIELQVGPIDDPVLHSPSVANMGNPHAIFWVDGDVNGYELERFGPLLENHPIFPERANISLARVTSPASMDLKVWERGVGLTLACGSAACAAAVSSARTGRTGRLVDVHLPGGILTIEWDGRDHVLMTGPIAYEAVGMVDLETLDADLVMTDDPFGAGEPHP